jgi:hypothetical protein
MVFLTRFILGLFVKSGYFNDKTASFINVSKKDIPDTSKNEEVKVKPFSKVNFLSKTKYFVGLSLIVIV